MYKARALRLSDDRIAQESRLVVCDERQPSGPISDFAYWYSRSPTLATIQNSHPVTFGDGGGISRYLFIIDTHRCGRCLAAASQSLRQQRLPLPPKVPGLPQKSNCALNFTNRPCRMLVGRQSVW